jgi:hypothetical protein
MLSIILAIILAGSALFSGITGDRIGEILVGGLLLGLFAFLAVDALRCRRHEVVCGLVIVRVAQLALGG